MRLVASAHIPNYIPFNTNPIPNSTSSPFPMQRFVPVSQKKQFCANLGCRISISKLLRQKKEKTVHFEAPETKKGENGGKRQNLFIVPTFRVSLWISCFLFIDIICHVVDFDSSFVVRVLDSISWIWPLLAAAAAAAGGCWWLLLLLPLLLLLLVLPTF